jgi:Na+/H+-dicarboxylate symporter
VILAKEFGGVAVPFIVRIHVGRNQNDVIGYSSAPLFLAVSSSSSLTLAHSHVLRFFS